MGYGSDPGGRRWWPGLTGGEAMEMVKAIGIIYSEDALNEFINRLDVSCKKKGRVLDDDKTFWSE